MLTVIQYYKDKENKDIKERLEERRKSYGSKARIEYPFWKRATIF